MLFLFVFISSLLTCLHALDVFIEPGESSKLLGPMDSNFNIVTNDVLNPVLTQRIIGSLRAIPECVNQLTLQWYHDGNQMIRYDIRRIISLNSDLLTVYPDETVGYRGFVPRDKKDFTLHFNCRTSPQTAKFSVYFFIEISLLTDTGEVMYGAPISMWLEKKCGACDLSYLNNIPDVSALGITRRPNKCGGCENGGLCAKLPMGYSKCRCKRGYTGVRCEEHVCKPGCMNGGQCVGPHVCSCPPNFRGPMCEFAVCSPPCSNGGYCNTSHQCTCPPGFSGDGCRRAPTVQITHAPDDIAVSSSQVVKFHCRATGKPRAKFTWLDNEERPIISKFRKPRHFKEVVNKVHGYSDLWIFGTRESDEGMYTCVAFNQFSMVTASATLTVDPTAGESAVLEEDSLVSGSGDVLGDYYQHGQGGN